MSISTLRRGSLAALLLCLHLSAQQPRLLVPNYAFSRSDTAAVLYWQLYGRQGDLYALLVDTSPGPTTLFGQTLDLGLTPDAFLLAGGVLGAFGATGSLNLAPNLLPPATLHMQFAEWDPNQGLSSLLVSTNAGLVFYDGPLAFTTSFDSAAGYVDGVFDRSVTHRLQALPPSRRTVDTVPPSVVPFLAYSELTPLHPSGSRLQFVVRASDLGGNGLPETLTSVRWRPLFGGVSPEFFPQFELRASHSLVVPDFTIDPWSALPVEPNSGLQATFASNPSPGTTQTTLYSGPYAVSPAALQPSGYLPFPVPQQTFTYDGHSSLLLETLCPPTPGGGAPQNFQGQYLSVTSSPFPYASVAAIAGVNGQPSPLQPGNTPSGTGGPYHWDWELEFERTTSRAQSQWMAAFTPMADYLPAVAVTSSLPGTSIVIEFRGAIDNLGTSATAWSTSTDVADGLPWLQYRITMVADPVTGAVPWVESLVIPFQ